MPTEVWTALISGVVGLATGSVATAWANWGIEKRRLKVNADMSCWTPGVLGLHHSTILMTSRLSGLPPTGTKHWDLISQRDHANWSKGAQKEPRYSRANREVGRTWSLAK